MKKILFFCVALLTVAPVFAQSDGEDDFGSGFVKTKKNAFFFGPKIGGVLSTMSQPDEGKLADGSGFGLSAGLALKTRFGRATDEAPAGTGFFGVGLELKYRQSKVKTLGTDEKGKEKANLSLGYFDVPVYVHVYPLAKINAMNSLYIELGASFGSLLSRSPKSLSVENPSTGYSKATYYLNAEGSKLKGGDMHPLVGLGYTIPHTGLDINARYHIGTTKLAGNFPSKVSAFEISLSYLFRVAKF